MCIVMYIRENISLSLYNNTVCSTKYIALNILNIKCITNCERIMGSHTNMFSESPLPCLEG